MAISTAIFGIFLASAQMISLDTKDMDLGDFLRLMANIGNMNVVLHPAIQGRVNLMVRDAPWEQVLDLVLKNHGLAKDVEGNIMRIAPAASFEAEQREKASTKQACLNALPLQTHVYVLNYATAEGVAPIISKMISPRGSIATYPSRNALIVTDVARPEQCGKF